MVNQLHPTGSTQESVEIWIGDRMNCNQPAEKYRFALISPGGNSLATVQKLGSPIWLFL